MAKKKGKFRQTLEDFKAFISKGSILDLAVGVIIGGAFNAIVNALVSILMSICTWGVPGGIDGLVTVLPAANEAQAGIAGIGQTFTATPQGINGAVNSYAEHFGVDADIARTEVMANYTLHGEVYYYNNSAIIDWGTFINAIISFFIIALTLFIIVRVFNYMAKRRADFEARALEEYYEKHPEERPVEPEPEPAKPTEAELLTEILAELKKANGTEEKAE